MLSKYEFWLFHLIENEIGFPKWVIVYLTLNSLSFIQIFVDLHEVAKNFARATPGTASTERSLKVKGYCAHAFNDRYFKSKGVENWSVYME